VTISTELQAWILDKADPSVEYRYRLDVLGARPDTAEVQAAKAQIGHTGWAAKILKIQRPSGSWETDGATGGELYSPKYTASNWQLLLLSELGAYRTDPRIARGAELLLEKYGAEGVFDGRDAELCVTGNAVRMILDLGYSSHPSVIQGIEWLCGAQKSDGGWHCFPSEAGTLDGWEALAAFASIPPERRSAAVQQAIRRGAEFYLARHLLDEGEPPYAPWRRLHYPHHYYYDVLLGLDLLTRLGYGRDPRLVPALELLESKRDAAGRWPLESVHPDIPPQEEYAPSGPIFPICLELPGRASRWITVTALTILQRAGRL
jgi:hypothetical protein